MLYLICREDQVPENLAHNGGHPLDNHRGMQYYPRLIHADSVEDAIENSFAPEVYQPSGRKNLVVMEVGAMFTVPVVPVPPPPPPRNYTLGKKKRRSIRIHR